jgi:hypothetical protein
MLHELLAEYLPKVERTIRSINQAYIERYSEEVLTPQRVNLRVRIRFNQGHLLEMHEAILVENGRLVHLDYRYHFQDNHNRLIFRYDGTPHFPDLPGFPHHRHLPDSVIPAVKPDIADAIQEAVDSIG